MRTKAELAKLFSAVDEDINQLVDVLTRLQRRQTQIDRTQAQLRAEREESMKTLLEIQVQGSGKKVLENIVKDFQLADSNNTNGERIIETLGYMNLHDSPFVKRVTELDTTLND